MAEFVGEAVAVRAVALHPFTKKPLTDLTGTLEVFNPSKDPKGNPADRAVPDASVGMAYDEESEGYVGFWPSTAPAGRWTYRVHLVGGVYDNFEFGTITLKP